MNARTTAAQGALAAAGLVAAYLTWQRPAQSDVSGKVTVVAATHAALEKVRYERRDQWLELVRDASGEGSQFLLERGIRIAPPPAPVPDGGAPAAIPTPPKFKPGQYKASERAAKLHEKLAPLTAQRALGKLAPDKLKELGLEGSEKRLELVVSGTRRTFKLAQSDGGGTYLLDEGDGQAWLVSGSTLADFETPDSLVDRRLHAFERAEIDAFVVAAGGKSRSFVQKAGEGGVALGAVAPADKPDQPDEQVRNWYQKLWTRPSALQVLPKGEEPPGGAEPETVLRVDYSWRHKPKGWLEIAKGKGGGFFARSEYTAGWVQLSGAEDLVGEATQIVGG